MRPAISKNQKRLRSSPRGAFGGNVKMIRSDRNCNCVTALSRCEVHCGHEPRLPILRHEISRRIELQTVLLWPMPSAVSPREPTEVFLLWGTRNQPGSHLRPLSENKRRAGNPELRRAGDGKFLRRVQQYHGEQAPVQHFGSRGVFNREVGRQISTSGSSAGMGRGGVGRIGAELAPHDRGKNQAAAARTGAQVTCQDRLRPH